MVFFGEYNTLSLSIITVRQRIRPAVAKKTQNITTATTWKNPAYYSEVPSPKGIRVQFLTVTEVEVVILPWNRLAVLRMIEFDVLRSSVTPLPAQRVCWQSIAGETWHVNTYSSVNTGLNNRQYALSTVSLNCAWTSVFRDSVTNENPLFSVLFSANFGLGTCGLYKLINLLNLII